jgi:hypothetical protein
LQHADTRAQEQMPNCFRPECLEFGMFCDHPITPSADPACYSPGFGQGSQCDQSKDICETCVGKEGHGVWCGH